MARITWKEVLRQRLAFLIAVSVAGISTLGVGVALIDRGTPFWSNFLVTIGTGFLGSAFALAFGEIFGPGPLRDFFDQLSVLVQGSLSAEERDLEPWRKRWHGYLLTKHEDKWIWRYRIVDFSERRLSGRLFAKVKVPRAGAEHSSVIYEWEGFVTGSRLLCISRPETGTEPPVIFIYPQGGKDYLGAHAGLAVLESWDGDEIVTLSLFSEKPVLEGLVPGTLEEKHYPLFFDLWQKEFRRVSKLDALLLHPTLRTNGVSPQGMAEQFSKSSRSEDMNKKGTKDDTQ